MLSPTEFILFTPIFKDQYYLEKGILCRHFHVAGQCRQSTNMICQEIEFNSIEFIAYGKNHVIEQNRKGKYFKCLN
jgi:hypothetical protein